MIYFDNASTTPIKEEVLDAMMPYLTEHFGNPSSNHFLGRAAKAAIEKAREQCAKALNCKPEEIYFTSGATESNQWLIANTELDRYYSTAIEHKSLLVPSFSSNGVIRVNENGIISVCDCYNRPFRKGDTLAVTLVNNELGVIQPIKELNILAAKKKINLHVDATQAVGKVKIDLQELSSVTTLSMSGHKIGAPKGVGLMFIRKCPCNAEFGTLLSGGRQERRMRAGTENVAGIVGLGMAMELAASRNIEKEANRISFVRDIIKEGLSKIPDVIFNSDCGQQLPYYISASFKGIESEALINRLSLRGVYISSGSACNSGSVFPSDVLKTVGVPDDYIYGTIRISLSEDNTREEAEKFLEIITEEIAKLRENLPSWKGSEADDSN